MKPHLILVAGGTGTRMQQPVAKQFILLKGRPLMWWTLQRFREALGEELEVVLVLHESLVQPFYDLEEKYGAAGVNQVITGGAERWHSVLHGLNALPDMGVVGIHDAVRPFVSVSTILDCYQTAAASGSAVPVVPVKDSIREVHGAGSHAVTRDRLRAVQTPQCFDIQLLKSAYDAGYREEFTDDASVFEYAGHSIHLVEGDFQNIKVTTPEDLLIARAFVEGFSED